MIRPAVAADAPAVAAILAREIEARAAHFATVAPTAAAVAEEIAGTGAHPFLVATDGDALAGFARTTPWKSRGAYAWTVELGVYLAEAWQRRGIGRALAVATLDLARTRGFRTVLAGIALPNPASVGLVEALGFRHVGTLPAVGYKHGAWRDVGYWALRLGDDGPPGAAPGVS
ncbi:MAG: GNAT family N-acetyltransferase [Myxococcota bacterium]